MSDCPLCDAGVPRTKPKTVPVRAWKEDGTPIVIQMPTKAYDAIVAKFLEQKNEMPEV